jgi:hypothetical protein
MRFLAAVAIVLALVANARSQTGPRCDQFSNFACSNGTAPPGAATQDVGTSYNFTASTPFSFEGATADAFEINVSVGDPSGSDKTFFVPGSANSAAATATNLPCSAGNHISDFNAGTGVFTCSADSGGSPVWNSIGTPTGSLSLSFDPTELTTLTWTGNTSTSNFFTLLDATGNTGTGHVLDVHTVGTSTAKPIIITAGGTANGVEMSNAGVLAAIGTGVNRANDVVCTTCVGTSDIADNAVDGAKIAITSQATNDIMYYDGTDWVRLASASGFLKGGSTPVYASITSSDIGAGDLQNALTWEEVCTADPCTLAATPRASNTMLAFMRGVKLRNIGSTCSGFGVNEYAYNSGTHQIDLCWTSGVSTGADSFQVSYEL